MKLAKFLSLISFVGIIYIHIAYNVDDSCIDAAILDLIYINLYR